MAKNKKTKNKISAFGIALVGLVVLVFGLLDHFKIISLGEKADITEGIQNALESDTSVSFIDVGQGNSALVISGDSSMLIDGGEAEKGKDVVAYLKTCGITKLDYIIATHQHTDHIGGLIDVINSDIEVSKIIMPKIPDKLVPTSLTYTNLLNAIKNKGLKVNTAKDEEFSLGSVTVNTFAMSGDYSDLNNYSVVTKITTNAGKFLIMGDLETTAEKELISKKQDLSADVLAMGHHGSSSSTGSNLLKAVNPVCAVISVGSDNSYGHPNEAALKRVKKYTDMIYRTDKNGNIVFGCDFKNLDLTVEKE